MARALFLPLLTALALGACHSLSEEDQDKLAGYRERARLYYENTTRDNPGGFQRAMDQIERGLALEPEDYGLNLLRAMVALRQYQFARRPEYLAQAETAFAQVSELRSGDDHSPQYWLGFGMAQLFLGQNQRAEADAIQESLKQAPPGDPFCDQKDAKSREHEAKARAYLMEAKRCFQRLIDRDTMTIESHFRLAQANTFLREFPAAIENAQKHLDLSVKRQDQIQKRILATDNAREERSLFAEQQDLAEQEKDVRGQLAHLFFKLGRHEDAVKQLDELLAKDPTRSADYFNRGRSLVQLGRKEEARQDFNNFLRTTRLPPDAPQVVEAFRALEKL